MQFPVVTLKQYEDVKTIYETLKSNSHNGYPVVNNSNIVVGMISRRFLYIILKHRYFETIKG